MTIRLAPRHAKEDARARHCSDSIHRRRQPSRRWTSGRRSRILRRPIWRINPGATTHIMVVVGVSSLDGSIIDLTSIGMQRDPGSDEEE